MITIDQLLESVNYQIEPKWVTKDKDGTICIFGCDKPEIAPHADFWAREEPCIVIYHIKLAEFADKPWQECIYEVPRNTTGKIEKLDKITTINHSTEAVFGMQVHHWLNEIIKKQSEVISKINDIDLEIAKIKQVIKGK